MAIAEAPMPSAPPGPAELASPLAPQTLEETGLTSTFIADLAVKVL